MTAIRVTARQLTAHDYFVTHGYHTNGAGAIVGNGCGESGENLDSTFERAHADHGSGGFLEWRDSSGAPRKTKFAEFADARGPNLRSDLITQCAYAIWELENDFPSLNEQLKNPGNRTIANLTANFCFVFENPAKATAGLDNRIAHAEAVVARAAEIKAAPAPQPAPPAPAPQVPAPTEPPPQTPPPAPPAGLPPVLPSQAGRIAAIIDMLYTARDDRIEELIAADPEIKVLDGALAAAGEFGAHAASPALPLPAVPAANQKGNMMATSSTTSLAISVAKSIVTNWVTSAAGTIAGAPSVLDVINTIGTTGGVNWKADAWGVGTFLLGLAAKDGWISGGVVAATPEAAKRLEAAKTQ